MEKQRIRSKGITLIALVITIIVLLILAGVTIATLTGQNGILTNAKKSKDETEKANFQEQVQIEVLSSYQEKGELDFAILKKNLEEKLSLTITQTDFPIEFDHDTNHFMIGKNGEVITDQYITEGLVLHYDAINNTGTGHDDHATVWKDLSENGNDGILQDFADGSWQSNALTFDGIDDWIKITQMNYSAVTLEMVVEFNDIPNGNLSLISNVESGGYELVTIDKTPCVSVFVDEINGYKVLHTDEKIKLNQKNYYSGKYDNQKITLFHNGKKDELPQTGTIRASQSNTILIIGANPSGPSVERDLSFLHGKVNAVRVYDRALTDQEINQNYRVDQVRYPKD